MRRLVILAFVLLLIVVGGIAAIAVATSTSKAAPTVGTESDAASNNPNVSSDPVATSTPDVSSVSATSAGPAEDKIKVAQAPTATGGVSVDATAIPASSNLSGLSSPRVLAWNPNKTVLAWYAASGQPVPITQASSAKALIIPCGMTPTGDQMIIYQGGDTAQPFLYPMAGGNALALGTTTGLACSIQHRTQISPDGNRLALMKYDQNSVEGNYLIGTLRILKMPEGTEQKAIDSVTSFDLQNDGVTFLQFFANTKKEANSADLIFWDGAKERRIEEGIKPLENCQFVVGRSLRVGDKVYTLLGEKCKVGGSKWRLIRTDFAGGNSANVASGPTGANGGAVYFSSTGTNDLWLMPGGKELLIAVPNGLNPDVMNLARFSLADNKLSNVLGGVVIDQYPPAMPRRFLFSPKKDWLAMITRDGNGAEKLFLYNLNAPNNAPEAIAGGNRSDRINAIAWTADGEKLFYVITGEDNAMRYISTKGEKKLVVRGQFQGLAVSPDGAAASTSEQIQQAANDLRNNLILVNVAEVSKVTLVEGGKGEGALTPIAVR